jgi:uncharacterized repeat protein (TIGR03803 family)
MGGIRMTARKRRIPYSQLWSKPICASLAFLLALVVSAVEAQPVYARTFKTIYEFKGGADGNDPEGPLIRDSAGNLYGTTYYGGGGPCKDTKNDDVGCGTVFRISRNGTETVLHSFTGEPDGIYPVGGLVLDGVGNLYGTTTSGGKWNMGTVFKLEKNGRETILHHFAGVVDGANPWGDLMRDGLGRLYGTTVIGGSSGCFENYGCGTVFKLTQTSGDGWVETVLHRFVGQPDGENPYAGLVADRAGNLYGTTEFGGTGEYGTVFKVDKVSHETVLHNFGSADGGDVPDGTLIFDPKGNLYGTTTQGGPGSCRGTVFELDTTGKFVVLYCFESNGNTGAGQPQGSLTRDEKGNLYGTTNEGGINFVGTVFRVDGNQGSVLHIFNWNDGSHPDAGLVWDGKGNLYGTTALGGINYKTCNLGCGVVFKITP